MKSIQFLKVVTKMGNPLKARRFIQKKTQYQLAKESGVSQSRISLFENGFIKLSLKEKRLIADALEYPTEQLFSEN